MTAVEGVFGALADPTRLRLLDLIAQHGTATATMLADELPISRQGIVQHLTVLADVGLVAGRREGRERRFHVRSVALSDAAAWMEERAQQWDVRLAAIKGLAEQE
jgi:DNA-binding transcriptional ArsR family regulator